MITSYLHITSLDTVQLDYVSAEIPPCCSLNQICWAFALCWPLLINYFLLWQRSGLSDSEVEKLWLPHLQICSHSTWLRTHEEQHASIFSRGLRSFLGLLGRLLSFLILQDFPWSATCDTQKKELSGQISAKPWLMWLSQDMCNT